MYIIIITMHLPLADHSEGVTVTVIGLLANPPVILTTTCINPDNSEPTNFLDANSINSAINQK